MTWLSIDELPKPYCEAPCNCHPTFGHVPTLGLLLLALCPLRALLLTALLRQALALYALCRRRLAPGRLCCCSGLSLRMCSCSICCQQRLQLCSTNSNELRGTHGM